MVNEEHPTPNWHFAQCFGDKGDVEDITEADIISTVEFDHTGDYLATGDKGGRVVLFERFEGKKGCEYKFYNEFQSHEPEFDYLKSLEIEEKINKIKWCRRLNAAHFLLSTNGTSSSWFSKTHRNAKTWGIDKTIKLWKIYEKSIKVVAENNLNDGIGLLPRSPNNNPLTFAANNGPLNSAHGGIVNIPQFTRQSLRLPRMTHHETIVTATPRRTFQNAHAYHINSISVNSDAETFISADDLRINLWNLNIPDQSFNIVDIKPVNMEELTEVITAAEFHPIHCNYFAYSSSKGTIKLADMRESALCDHHAKLFEVEEDPVSKSFFSEIISSVCDIRFSRDGQFVLSRDFLTLKIWDLRMDGRTPLQTINIHDHLRHKLCDLYESDCIFDKFECTFSGDGKHALTGSYNNNFMIYPIGGGDGLPGSLGGKGGEILLQADKSAFKAKKSMAQAKKAAAARGASPARVGGRATPPPSALSRNTMDVDSMDFNKKILHLSWHPYEDTVAIAATNNLFLFSATTP